MTNTVKGRPKKDTTKVRDKRLTLRFTAGEWNLLTKRSQEYRLSKADYLRQCTLASEQVSTVQPLIPEDVLALLRNLTSLSGAVLQLGHKVSHEKIISAELKQTALRISNIVQQTYDYLEQNQ